MWDKIKYAFIYTITSPMYVVRYVKETFFYNRKKIFKEFFTWESEKSEIIFEQKQLALFEASLQYAKNNTYKLHCF